MRSLSIKRHPSINQCAEYAAIDVSREIARALHANGIGKPEPTTFTEEDFKQYSEMVSQNICRSRTSLTFAFVNSCIISVRMLVARQIVLVN
jgi:hypothetical protein